MRLAGTSQKLEEVIAVVYLGSGGNFFCFDEETLQESLKMYHDKGVKTYVFRKEEING